MQDSMLPHLAHPIDYPTIIADARAFRADIEQDRICPFFHLSHWLRDIVQPHDIDFVLDSNIGGTPHAWTALLRTDTRRPQWRQHHVDIIHSPITHILGNLMGYAYLRYAMAHTRQMHPTSNIHFAISTRPTMDTNAKRTIYTAQAFAAEVILPHDIVHQCIIQRGMDPHIFDRSVLSPHDPAWGPCGDPASSARKQYDTWKSICADVIESQFRFRRGCYIDPLRDIHGLIHQRALITHQTMNAKAHA